MTLRIIISILLLPLSVEAQIVGDDIPYVLTIEQLKVWTPDGVTADEMNVSTVEIQSRFELLGTQLNPLLSNDMEVIFAPDGMGNLANYVEEQDKFNLYNFTHWNYIDKIIWFGGTAEKSIHIPSKPWVETAHKNGVEVYGNIFFAPTVFGGNSVTVSNFLEKNASGKFIAAEKLKEIAVFYGFDGWFINMETSTSGINGHLMRDFVEELRQVLPESKEIIWYDAMLLNGNVSWQNQLNSSNSTFFQEGNSLISDAVFINFFWSGSTRPRNSRTTANNLNRSEFDVFTGVDLWPSRNQAPFEEGGNKWMSDLHDGDDPITSLGLFVPNAIFDNAAYSNFRSEDSEEQRSKFYQAERHLFSGLDRNPTNEDNSGFKGLSHWIPSSSNLTTLPFVSNFNTGHGRIFANNGAIENRNWHDIGKQDILPTWQFAISGTSDLSADFDFTQAYNGGSSLKIEGALSASGSTTLKLYKTKFSISSDSKIDIIYTIDRKGDSNMEVIVSFSDKPDVTIGLEIDASNSNGWNINSIDLSEYEGKEIAMIGLRFSANEHIGDYRLNLGQLAVYDGEASDQNRPIANFEVTSQNVKVGGQVAFLSKTSTGAQSWSWAFPGGSPSFSDVENPSITYEEVGKFDVSLIVSNEAGSDTVSRNEFISVDDNPRASFTESSKSIQVGESITYTNNSENSTTVVWQFAGGTPFTSSEDIPLVEYTMVGCFDVRLVASNAAGVDTILKEGHVSVRDDDAVDHTDPVGTGIITARAEINQSESKEKAFDNFASVTANTKWLDNGGVPSADDPSWIQMQFPEKKIVNTLVVFSANDAPERDPEDFQILASNDGMNFILLKNWQKQIFVDRLERKSLPFFNQESYKYYRLEITKNIGDVSLMQIGEIELRGPERLSDIEELHEKNYLMSIYPNPTYAQVTVEGAFPEHTNLMITDEIGMSVGKLIPIRSYTTVIDLSGVPRGIYSLIMMSSKHVLASRQIVVE